MNKIKILQFVGIGFSVVGMIVSNIAGDMSNKEHLAKLVNKK